MCVYMFTCVTHMHLHTWNSKTQTWYFPSRKWGDLRFQQLGWLGTLRATKAHWGHFGVRSLCSPIPLLRDFPLSHWVEALQRSGWGRGAVPLLTPMGSSLLSRQGESPISWSLNKVQEHQESSVNASVGISAHTGPAQLPGGLEQWCEWAG